MKNKQKEEEVKFKEGYVSNFECHIGVPCDGQYIKIHKRIKKAKSL